MGVQYYPYLFNDLWNDEIYSLKNFTLQALKLTLTDYHVPNNHIFYNLINGIVLKLFGITNINGLLENALILKFLNLVYLLGSLYFFDKIIRQTANKNERLYAILIYLTTIPILSFSFQLRGYGLSLFLLTWVLSKTLHKNNARTIFGLAILSCLLVYTLPTNIYVLISLIGFLLLIKYKSRNLSFDPSNKKLLGLLIGCVFGISLYIPCMSDMFNYTQLNPDQNIGLLRFLKNGFYVLRGTISARYLLIPIVISSIYIMWERNEDRGEFNKLLLLFATGTMPLAISFLIRDGAPLRIFLVCFPCYLLIISLLLIRFLRNIADNHKFEKFIHPSLSIYFLIVFMLQVGLKDQRAFEDLSRKSRYQNLYFQYYNNLYRPNDTVNEIKEFVQSENLPIVLIGLEEHGFPNFLDKEQLKYEDYRQVEDALKMHKSFYLVTSFPLLIKKKYKDRCRVISKNLSYHTILIFD